MIPQRGKERMGPTSTPFVLSLSKHKERESALNENRRG
jgi:hypothetical protein